MKVYIVRQASGSLDDSDDFLMVNVCVFSKLESAIECVESMGFVKNENYKRPGAENQIWTSVPKFNKYKDKARVMFIDEFDILY